MFKCILVGNWIALVRYMPLSGAARPLADHAVLTPKSGLPSIETMDIALLHRPTADAAVKELARVLSRMFGPQRR